MIYDTANYDVLNPISQKWHCPRGVATFFLRLIQKHEFLADEKHSSLLHLHVLYIKMIYDTESYDVLFPIGPEMTLF